VSRADTTFPLTGSSVDVELATRSYAGRAPAASCRPFLLLGAVTVVGGHLALAASETRKLRLEDVSP
jgi:hypothetical protein